MTIASALLAAFTLAWFQKPGVTQFLILAGYCMRLLIQLRKPSEATAMRAQEKKEKREGIKKNATELVSGLCDYF